jgi:hypothetical protein
MKSIMFEDDENLCKYMSDNKVTLPLTDHFLRIL